MSEMPNTPEENDSDSEISMNPKSKEPHEVLGLPKGATLEDVKKRFLELQKKHHTDSGAENQDVSASLNEAYEFLSGKNLNYYIELGANGISPLAFVRVHRAALVRVSAMRLMGSLTTARTPKFCA